MLIFLCQLAIDYLRLLPRVHVMIRGTRLLEEPVVGYHMADLFMKIRMKSFLGGQKNDRNQNIDSSDSYLS